MRAAAFGAALLMTAGASIPASAAEEDFSTKSVATLEQCVAALNAPGSPFQPPSAQARIDALPGLSRGNVQFAWMLPSGPDSNAYLYYGGNGRELYCGLAVYGRLPPFLRKNVVSLAERLQPKLVIDDPPHYRLVGEADAQPLYWGTVRGPGLMGLLMLERGISPERPAFEAGYHRILVR